MNYIKFNEYQCEVLSFNKYTTFQENTITGTCNCQIVTSDLTGLQNLGLEGITEIQIIHDEEIIYDLQNINARIASINENLVNDHIDVMLAINF